MFNATLEKEFYVETSDKTGTAGQFTDVVSNHDSNNIKAIWGGSFGGKGYFSFIPENWSQAKETLSSSDFSNYREEDVIVVYVDDKAGSVYDITSKFASANIGINWFYTTYYNGKPAVVISCTDCEKGMQVISQ